MSELLNRLLKGNEKYLNSDRNIGNTSLEVRQETFRNGQHPFAVVITCSDSRVIPEAIFSCGIGELFVIRVAGNIIGPSELASIEYATSHLKCKLVMVLGHTHCGAIHSAVHDEHGNYVDFLLNHIKTAIKDEKDEYKAMQINVLNSSNTIKEKIDCSNIEIVSAIYDIETGKVNVL